MNWMPCANCFTWNKSLVKRNFAFSIENLKRLDGFTPSMCLGVGTDCDVELFHVEHFRARAMAGRHFTDEVALSG
jgi:hypothetical protein